MLNDLVKVFWQTEQVYAMVSRHQMKHFESCWSIYNSFTVLIYINMYLFTAHAHEQSCSNDWEPHVFHAHLLMSMGTTHFSCSCAPKSKSLHDYILMIWAYGQVLMSMGTGAHEHENHTFFYAHLLMSIRTTRFSCSCAHFRSRCSWAWEPHVFHAHLLMSIRTTRFSCSCAHLSKPLHDYILMIWAYEHMSMCSWA